MARLLRNRDESRNADLILVMHEGEIVERGTHTELVERRNYYANLVQAQSAADEPELALAG